MIEKNDDPTRAKRNEAAKAKFNAALERMREGFVAASEALAEVDLSLEACGSREEFAKRSGATPDEAWRLASVGRATAVFPAVKEDVVQGKISIETAAQVGKVAAKPGLQRQGDDWVQWAREDTPKEFRDRVSQRIEESRPGGETARPADVRMGDQGHEDLARARVIASRRAQRTLTNGETVEASLRHYLVTFDPMEKKGAARRMPDTTDGTPGRKIAAEEQRKILARGNDRCQFPGCTNRVWLQYAHIRPHSHGSGREARHILRLCCMHHRMLDDGLIRVSGPADHPTFTDPEGRPLGGRGPP